MILKNPANTARIKILLEMFPDAKFIHISRHPYHVYLSMMRFLTSIKPLICLQKPPNVEQVKKFMIEVYKQMYHKYFREKKLIPKESLVEILNIIF